ncbi:tetratricopeptide repeat protein [Planctomyces sp. SH-PL62]|uniref:tetratricopeptide repeat protein n=1 Tax=Planctomyces sp. SH-PL62 TaxID=1636152 RepID=UPI00078C5B13|nr:hypothetical protein [Planctomyces sp. SH-PL62]AMV36146.1 hypothetical protein VT85_01790 [Planctomyces sp. SH-PL62]
MSGTVRTAAWALATVWVVATVVGIVVSGSSGRLQDGPPKPIVKGPPISQAEALEFGEGLADALARLDAKAVEEAIDLNALMEAASEGVKAPPRFREEFYRGTRNALERNGHTIFIEFRPVVEAGAVLRATQGIEWEGRPAFVLRVLPADGGVAYSVFILDRRPDGRIRAVDHYSLAVGEPTSQVIRRLYQAGVAQANRGLLDRLMGKEQPLIKHMDDTVRMAAANREGRSQEVLTIYDALPEELKNEKIFQVGRFNAAQKIGDEAKYLEVIQDFARRFPGDPACDLLLLDGYVLMNQPEKALECVDRLEKVLGKDAYLKVLRGGVLTLLKRPDDAIAAYRAAIAEEPDLWPAYDALLVVTLEQKQFEELAKLLDSLESQFEEDAFDLLNLDGFTEFFDSPEGKAWTEKRDKPKSDDEAPKP